MEKVMNLNEVMELLVKKKIISENVKNISIECDNFNDNILTNEEMEPTEYLEALVSLTGNSIEYYRDEETESNAFIVHSAK